MQVVGECCWAGAGGTEVWFQSSDNLVSASCQCCMEPGGAACLGPPLYLPDTVTETRSTDAVWVQGVGLLGSSGPFRSDLGCSWLPRKTACRGRGSVTRAHFKKFAPNIPGQAAITICDGMETRRKRC